MRTPSDQKLNDAVNLLCEYCEHHLADDYEIVLRMNSVDAGIDLIDPEGYDVLTDVDECSVRELCDQSREESEQPQ